MKITTLAYSISALFILPSASAVTLIESDNFTYKLKGDLQVQLRKDVGEEQNLDVEFDDLQFDNLVNFKLNDELDAFGHVSVDFSDNAESDEYSNFLNDAYIGLKYQTISFSMGMQDYATDDFGVEEAYEMRSDSSGFDTHGTDGNDVLRVDVDLDNVQLSLSTELRAEGEDSEGTESYDLFAVYTVGPFELAAAYQSKENEMHGDRVDTYGTSIRYNGEWAEIGLDYSEIENGNRIYNVSTVIPTSEQLKFSIGYVATLPNASDDIYEWYTNVTYHFAQNDKVSVFAEISDTNEPNIKLGYLAGLRLKF
jgi:predicted porin